MRQDVCVVGAGPAGAVAAIAAAAAGARVTLVGAPRSPLPRPLELLSGRASESLAALGLLDLVHRLATPCDGTVSRWATRDFVERSSLLEPRGGGWVVDRARLDDELVSAAEARGVRVLRRAVRSLVGAASSGDGVRVCGAGSEVVAERVVVAVGAGSGLVRSVTPRGRRHRMLALTVVLPRDSVSGLGHRLLVDRAPRGWWYALADDVSTTVTFCTDAALLGTGRSRVAVLWRDAAASAGDWLPTAALALVPRARAVTVGGAAAVAVGRLRLVGDAALAVDPLSGHGLALALESARRWDDPSYPQWAADAAATREQQEREAYGAASGPVGGRFWTMRQARTAVGCDDDRGAKGTPSARASRTCSTAS